jgi:hypothetical protein
LKNAENKIFFLFRKKAVMCTPNQKSVRDIVTDIVQNANRTPPPRQQESQTGLWTLDFGFWILGIGLGSRLGGIPFFSNKLDGLHHEGLFAAYQHIMQTEGGKLGPHDVYKRVANLFNIWHIGLLYTRMIMGTVVKLETNMLNTFQEGAGKIDCTRKSWRLGDPTTHNS